jgi:hypothetical protein
MLADATDMRMLNASREHREELIEMLCNRHIQWPDKPRTYMEVQIFVSAKFTEKGRKKK